MDEIGTVECLYCKKPVLAQEALPIQFENENGDGGMYTAVFHRPPEYGCAANFALDKLGVVGIRLQAALQELADTLQKMRNNGQL